MQSNDIFFGLNEKEISEIEEKYALFEPLLGDYLSPYEMRKHRRTVCQQLQISERSLRRIVRRIKNKGIVALIRKKRSDAGKKKVFSDEVLSRSLEMLEENPYRSVTDIKNLLSFEPKYAELAKKISNSTLYLYLKKSGYDFGKKNRETDDRNYHQFQAKYVMLLWQGDARHGIPLPHPKYPNKKKMTYLFAWMDDFSRKIMFARYYWDEKLPRMEDCFRQAVLRWGLPEKLYCDNGKVYISSHFLFVTNELSISKIHHPAYSAWCKGKIESMMKRFKHFQREALLAGFQTIEELNTALWAWIEVEYHHKIHSSTGETPNDRFADNVKLHPPKRIANIEEFNSLFLWRTKRTVSKYGRISMESNIYSVPGVVHKTVVEVRYSPFDLSEVQIYKDGAFLCKAKANVLNRKQIRNIPEESKKPVFGKTSINYFTKLREAHNEQKKKELKDFKYSDLKKEDY